MSLHEIHVQPSGTETHHTQTVVLEGQRYTLTCYTNAIDDRWYLDFEAADGWIRGVALAAGVSLLEPYRHLGAPPGWLFVGADADPDRDAFKEKRAKLLYLDSEDAA